MSLTGSSDGKYTPCFPRVSGDEPLYRFAGRERAVFSPRERG